MKFKDKVVLLFLVAVLLYAVCYRNNILPFGKGRGGVEGENITNTLADTIGHQVTEIPIIPVGEGGNLSEI